MSLNTNENMLQERHLMAEDGSSKIQRKKKRQRAVESGMKKFCDLYESTDEYLGEGGCGQVRTYRNISSKKEFAVKVIQKTSCHIRCKVLREIEILHHCRGQKNIVQLIEFFEEDDRFYLVFEKMNGGTLYDWIQKHGYLTEQEASAVIHDIVTALDFLHSKGIAHRDLKLENLLCENYGQLLPVKICDFDLSSEVQIDSNTHAPISNPELMSPVGSIDFMAPEVVDVWQYVAETYDKKCDLWSLGVVLYILLSGYKPFYVERGPNCDCTFNLERLCDDCQDLLFLNIQEGVYSFPESEWADISDSAKDLVSNLLVKDPRSRLATDQILEHPWIVDVESQMMPVLCRSQTMPVMCHRNDSGPSSSPLQFDMSPVNSLPSNYYGSNSDLEDSSPVQSSFNKKISSNCRSVTTTLSETIFHLDLSDEGVGSWKDTEEHKKATWSGLGYPIESGLAKRRALKLQRLSTGSNDSGNISSSSPPSRPQLLQTDK